ncbi:MAG: cation:proton antiporter regulatory subunit [Actinomycetes bacterium]
MDVQQTALPGIGQRYDFITASGYRIGIVVHRTGRQDLFLYGKGDPDACRDIVPLTSDEADALAEILGAPRMVERLADLRRIDNLVTEQISVEPGSPYAGRTLGDTRARTRTGASVVAVLRDGQVLPSPRPDFAFAPRDIVVVVGTPDGVTAVAEILGG